MVTSSTKVKKTEDVSATGRAETVLINNASFIHFACSHTLCLLTLEKQLNIILPEAMLIINELTLPDCG